MCRCRVLPLGPALDPVAWLEIAHRVYVACTVNRGARGVNKLFMVEPGDLDVRFRGLRYVIYTHISHTNACAPPRKLPGGPLRSYRISLSLRIVAWDKRVMFFLGGVQ